MKKVRFGKTELMVSEMAFGAIPIQRLSMEDAIAVVRGVIDMGVNFIDTANGYSDSEEKIGLAIKNIPRDSIIIASKSGARDKKGFLEHLDLSLKRMGTDYVDIYQHHGISTAEACNQVFAEDGAYEGMKEAIKAGKIRFPAFSSHSIPVAIELMKTGKFDVTQLPFNYIDNEAAKEAIPLAKKLDIGFIAMKPFGGGLLSDAKLTIKYLRQFDSIVPDPGIETLAEMEEIIRIMDVGEPFTEADAAAIELVKKEMGSTWCHRCEYCMPCPQKIGISMVLNLDSMIKRMPYSKVSDMMGPGMDNARTCTECKACVSRCPYDLDIPGLVKERVQRWDRYLVDRV